MKNAAVKLSAILFISGALLTACKEDEKPASAAQARAEAPASAITIDTVQKQLQAHNYGQAASEADKLTAATPNDPYAWFVSAEAKGANEQTLMALASLEQALSKGFKDLSRIESSQYLASVKNSEEYHNLLTKFGLIKVELQAGDAGIEKHGDETVIRAGDVSVKLPD